MKNKIAELVKKQSFQPGLIGIFLNPFYFIRRGLYLNIKSQAPELKGRLLDFGCGRKPYENLFSVDEYIGVDMEQTGHEHELSKIDVYYDGKNLPFASESFDSVFCSEVFEHVFNLNEIIPEIRRVMRPEGKILITVPFCWPEHEVPYDFARYSSFGIVSILERHGFRIVQQKKSGNFASVNFQLFAMYIYSLINTKSRAFNFILRMLFIIPINIVGSLVLPFLPVQRSLYFNNVIMAVKTTKKPE